MDYVPNPNGGRPIPKRYVTVIDMGKWVTGDKVPDVKSIVSPSKKRQARKAAESGQQKNETVAMPDTINVADIVSTPMPVKELTTPTPIKPKKIKKDETLEEMLEAAEAKASTPKTIKTTANINNDLIVIDAFKDVDNCNKTGRILIKNINNGEQPEVIKVNLKFDDGTLMASEAVMLSNGKYFLYKQLTKLQEQVGSEEAA